MVLASSEHEKRLTLMRFSGKTSTIRRSKVGLLGSSEHRASALPILGSWSIDGLLGSSEHRDANEMSRF